MSQTYSIGVDLGGTNLRVASYEATSGLMDTISLPTRLSHGRDRVVRDLCEAVVSLQHKGYNGKTFAGVGIGAPGPLELPEGILRNPPNLTGWDGFPLREAIETCLGHKVEIERDGNLAALAEAKLGAGREHQVDSLCILTLGTGVGNGIILNHRIWHGFSGMAGEAGHCIVQSENGAPCGCGGFGCLEQYASATAILRMARERMGASAPEQAHDLFLQAREGEPRALSIFHTVGHALAIALTALVNTLNLPLYVLGGGVCESWEMFAPVMLQELYQLSYIYRLTSSAHGAPSSPDHRNTKIVRAQLGSSAGLLGACLLPYEQDQPSFTQRPSRKPPSIPKGTTETEVERSS